MKKIIVLEDIIQLKNLDLTEYEVLSTSPKIDNYLDKNKINYKNIYEFFDIKFYDELIIQSDKFIHYINEDIKLSDNLKIKNSYKYTINYYYRFYITKLILSLYLVERIIYFFKPKYLNLFLLKYKNLDNISDFKFTFGNIFYEYIITQKLAIKTNLIKKEITSSYIFRSYFNSFFNLLNLLILKLLRKKILLLVHDSYGIENISNNFRKKNKNFLTLFFSISKKNIFHSIFNLFKLKYFFLITQNLSTKYLDEKIKNSIININFHKKHYYYKNLDIRLYLNNYFRSKIKFEIFEINKKINFFEFIKKKLNISLIISQNALGFGYAIGEYCQNNNLPTILVPHGTYFDHDKKLFQMQWNFNSRTIINAEFKYLLSRSKMMTNYINSFEGLKSNILLEKEKKYTVSIKDNNQRKNLWIKNYNKRIILHASTPKSYENLRPLIFETIYEYISNLNTLIRLVNNLNDVHLVIKFRPILGLTTKDLESKLLDSDCYHIDTNNNIEDCILNSDFLISYSSTVIEDSLLRKLPVLNYDPLNSYNHFNSPIIKDNINTDSPIYFCDSEKNLSMSISFMLRNFDYIKKNTYLWDNLINSDKEYEDIYEKFKQTLY